MGTVRMNGHHLLPIRFHNGRWECHVRTGNGWTNTTMYYGHWKRDSPHGLGTLFVGFAEIDATYLRPFLSTRLPTMLYTGSWKDGVRAGLGSGIADSGWYTGSWRDDRPNGFGCLYTNASRAQLLYSGEWKYGMRHGIGDGRVGTTRYEGDWVYNVRDGFGLLWKDDSNDVLVYRGTWKNNQRSGFGIQFHNGNTAYEGFWVLDTRNGSGRAYDRFMRVVCEGEWLMDRPPLHCAPTTESLYYRGTAVCVAVVSTIVVAVVCWFRRPPVTNRRDVRKVMPETCATKRRIRIWHRTWKPRPSNSRPSSSPMIIP